MRWTKNKEKHPHLTSFPQLLFRHINLKATKWKTVKKRTICCNFAILKRNLALLHWKYSGAITVPACTFRLSAEIYPEIEIYLQPIFTAKKQKAKSWSCVTWVIVHQRVRNDYQTKRLKMSTGKTFKLPIPEKSSKLFKIRFINFWKSTSSKMLSEVKHMSDEEWSTNPTPF